MPKEWLLMTIISLHHLFFGHWSLWEFVSDCFGPQVFFVFFLFFSGASLSQKKIPHSKQSPLNSHNDLKKDDEQLLLSYQSCPFIPALLSRGVFCKSRCYFVDDKASMRLHA